MGTRSWRQFWNFMRPPSVLRRDGLGPPSGQAQVSSVNGKDGSHRLPLPYCLEASLQQLTITKPRAWHQASLPVLPWGNGTEICFRSALYSLIKPKNPSKFQSLTFDFRMGLVPVPVRVTVWVLKRSGWKICQIVSKIWSHLQCRR